MNGEIREMLQVISHRAGDIVFPIVCGLTNRVDGFMGYLKTNKMHVIYSSLTSKLTSNCLKNGRTSKHMTVFAAKLPEFNNKVVQLIFCEHIRNLSSEVSLA